MPFPGACGRRRLLSRQRLGAGLGKIQRDAYLRSQPLTLDDAGRYAKGSLTFRQGQYLVRLIAFEDTPEIATAPTALAHPLSGKLK